MKIVIASAALIAIIGIAQVYEKRGANRRKSSPVVEKVEGSVTPSTFFETIPVARREERPVPPARYQKLFWTPAYDYRQYTIWI